MLISIYLHKQIAETLQCYGELSDVVNKILDASEQGAFDMLDMPKCEPRDGAARYNIDITNETYLELLDTFSVNSPRISLRRIIYWFVEQEMYEVLGWEVMNDYVDKDKEKILKKLGGIKSELFRIRRFLNTDELVYFNELYDKTEEFVRIIQNGR